MPETAIKTSYVETIRRYLASYSQRLASELSRFTKLEVNLNNPDKVKNYHKGMLILDMINKMIERCKKDYSSYLITEQASLKEISKYDPELSKKIIRAKLSMRRELVILIEIAKILQNIITNKDFGTAYVSTHLDEILNKVKEIKNKKLALILMDYFLKISGHEVDYLVKYTTEVRSWKEKMITMPLTYFVYVAKSFLSGDARLGYLGLLYYFRDEVIARRMYEKNNVRHMLNFLYERRYLQSIRDDIKNGITEGKWEDFYKFWNHIENVIKTLEEKYGSISFGEEIRKRKSEFGESPEQWLGLFNVILSEVYSPYYIRKRIIEPASIELEDIFAQRHKELVIAKEKVLLETKRLIDMVSKDSRHITLKVLQTILSEEEDLIKKRLESLKEKVKLALDRFEIALEPLQTEVQSIQSFLDYCSETAERIETNEASRSKIIDSLEHYIFRSGDASDTMRKATPLGTILANVFLGERRDFELVNRLEASNMDYIKYCFTILGSIYQLILAISNSFESLKQEIKPEFKEEFWQEISSENLQKEVGV